MHYKHVEAGAKQMDMGEWKRPHTYTSQKGEWQAVRESVGIIDLSTLGKLDVCVHITNVTGDYAAVNVAGPRARETLSKITDADLSTNAFPYMMCREATIAGVPAILLRIGFVGETGWEIHYPAAFGEYLWDAILNAGAEFGIRPFGVETQRILRLEKKHVIVGQDTDALSNPFEADMAWCVKFDKGDFIGRGGLEYLQQQAEQQKLVGFICDSATAVAEGSVIVERARPVGRVTSSRISPYLGRCIGMGWVPFASAKTGQKIQIRSDGADVSATVVDQPFYDPEGKRLRE